ncbi:MAG: hypothetical protein HQ500_05425 [Flavobacteriales bacterium]|nr:hypothetical protein [Flavobacteriales bacterium]
MRKVVALALLMVTGSVVFAQGAKVLNAYNYLNDGELLKAKEQIEPATEHEKTMNDGKTWYYRGQIFEQLYFSDDPKFTDQKEGSLVEAVKSFEKAIELGSKRINMNDVQDRYTRLGAFCYQEGVNSFNANKYEEALNFFLTCNSVREGNGAVDSGAIYSAAVAALNGKIYDKAEENFRKSIAMDYQVEDSYINLANMFKEMNASEKYKATLAEARKVLPNSQEIITAEINIYLESKEYDKALANLDLAIKNDPSNSLLYFVRGNIYDSKQASMMTGEKMEASNETFEKAERDYLKALEIKPDYFDAAYSVGALYYNRGAEMLNRANLISDDAAYRKAKEIAEGQLNEALPFLEKAHELNPEDVSTMTSLKAMYGRTNQVDKYNEMDEKLKN